MCVCVCVCVLGREGEGDGAARRSTKRSTHARPGMHMQQCSAVLHENTSPDSLARSICTDSRRMPCNVSHLAVLCWGGGVHRSENEKQAEPCQPPPPKIPQQPQSETWRELVCMTHSDTYIT